MMDKLPEGDHMDKTVTCFLTIVQSIILLILLALYMLEWGSYYTYVLIISVTLAGTLDRFLRIQQELGDKAGQQRRVLCIKRVALALFLFAVGSAIGYDSAIRSPAPVGFFRSADGQHELVVLKYTDAHSDVAYSAVPSMYRILYKDREPKNLAELPHFVISPNNKPARDIQVHWLDDGSARVYIIYDPAVGPVEQDSILVSFD